MDRLVGYPAGRAPRVGRPEPAIPPPPRRGKRAESGLPDPGLCLSGVAPSMAGTLRLRAAPGGDIHRSGVLRRHLLQSQRLGGCRSKPGAQPSPGGFLRAQPAPEAALEERTRSQGSGGWGEGRFMDRGDDSGITLRKAHVRHRPGGGAEGTALPRHERGVSPGYWRPKAARSASSGVTRCPEFFGSSAMDNWTALTSPLKRLPTGP